MYDSVKGRHLTILGFSFKKDSGDIRETPAITVCQNLLNEGARLHIYDPKVPHDRIIESFSSPTNIVIEDDVYHACKDTEALVIVTNWDMFASLDYERIYSSMNHPSFIFDSTHLVDATKMTKIGYQCYSLGQTLNFL
jgi:UDPglucose 6-dehydrogenase